MDEVFESYGEPRRSPEDKKTSLRNRYKRKLKHLANTLDQFINLANQRLDETQSGKIRRREEVQNLLEKCRDLRELLPPEGNGKPDEIERAYKSLSELFGISTGD